MRLYIVVFLIMTYSLIFNNEALGLNYSVDNIEGFLLIIGAVIAFGQDIKELIK